MPVFNRTLLLNFSHRSVQLVLSRHLSSSAHLHRDSQFQRHDFLTEGHTTTVEVRPEVRGPLSSVSKHGAPFLTPSVLKEHLDKFVVGQDKAKKVTSAAIYNHYQRIREIRRQEQEEADRIEHEERGLLMERERKTHPVENEFPGHTVKSADLNYRPKVAVEAELGSRAITLQDETVIEKSNLLLLGPTGVGKTYILSTLAKILEVPFATVDCSSLTQAGYIGTDIESSIERLLLAANHDISKCESGIIFLDELDKLAKPAVTTHGRDVSGEGVQQGLLKMIEGTSVTVNAKTDRNSKSENSRGGDRMDRGARDANANSSQGKSEQYTIDTSNILFVFAGAFVGLDRIINTRLSSGTSIGFGAQLKKEINKSEDIRKDDPLQYVTPNDLQTYGLIPELLGRIPILTALHALSLSQLVSILTEPKNSLIKQYTTLLATSNIQLRFTTPALRAIAERALSSPLSGKDVANKTATPGGGGGARGLRAIMESVLGEIMFWGPGSNIRFCLVDEKFVRGQDIGSSQFSTKNHAVKAENSVEERSLMPCCWSRGQGKYFDEAYGKEEEEWQASEDIRKRKERGDSVPVTSFEAYREVGTSGM
ncbi:P-loop containing nucleoside triphosphate hydrolase protein [Calycina marina]|uniref:P-loop containing nucleoside triphosphate hydrolase protein n=1 Tax=Calycina marina TaxID=1763456 RepID=A0A9P7YYN4_9HELO|nr:P-loop containing nucleoside triphosphate hydrolase protein [Calycina marina]